MHSKEMEEMYQKVNKDDKLYLSTLMAICAFAWRSPDVSFAVDGIGKALEAYQLMLKLRATETFLNSLQSGKIDIVHLATLYNDLIGVYEKANNELINMVEALPNVEVKKEPI